MYKKIKKKILDILFFILYNFACTKNGFIAQLARAFGSYPECHWFESS